MARLSLIYILILHFSVQLFGQEFKAPGLTFFGGVGINALRMGEEFPQGTGYHLGAIYTPEKTNFRLIGSGFMGSYFSNESGKMWIRSVRAAVAYELVQSDKGSFILGLGAAYFKVLSTSTGAFGGGITGAFTYDINDKIGFIATGGIYATEPFFPSINSVVGITYKIEE